MIFKSSGNSSRDVSLNIFPNMVFFSEDAMRRQSVRGGLTGLAQTSGRNNLLWEERFDYDLENSNLNKNQMFF